VKVRRKQAIDLYLGYTLIALLLPFTRLMGKLLRRDHGTMAPPRRIVFIKLMGLGSLIVASDPISALRKRLPGTKLILLADPTIAAAIRPFGLFDEIHVVSTDNLLLTCAAMGRFFFRTWTWRRLWVADLEVYSKLTTVLALLTLARNRFGFYLEPVTFRKNLNTHNIAFDQSAVLGSNYETMARALAGGAHLDLPGPPRRTDELNKPFVILNNTCSGLAWVRRMPDGVFAGLCQWLLDNTYYRLALWGAPEDLAEIDLFIRNNPALYIQKDRILNLAVIEDGFDGYYAFLRGSGAFMISIDSGPLHIARKLGLATISVWGPTDPAHYLRIETGEEQRHLVYYSRVVCSPCIHRYSQPPCGGNNICMNTLSVEPIIEKVRQLMEYLSASGKRELTERIEPRPPILI
jgi:ADP-heptose:LPS heptosyltransferase